MPGVILGMRVVDRSLLRGLGRRLAAIRKETLRDTAAHWHRQIFPRHFGATNRAAYAFAPRNPLYLRAIKRRAGRGVGRFRDQVLSGQSQRWMQAFFRITGTAGRATVRAFPPRYFTRPFTGSFTDPRSGRLKRVTRQPDKPDEVTRFNETDRRDLRRFAAGRMQALLAAARAAPSTRTITG